LFAFKTNVVSGPVVQTSIFGAIYIFFAVIITEFLHNKTYKIIGIIFLIIIFSSNLNLYLKDNFSNNKILAYQHVFYGDEKRLVDYSYKAAGYKNFSICAVSNPLFINTLWSVLFKTYGQTKYGYAPVWSGQKQYFIPSMMSYDSNHEAIRFLIIEPMTGIPEIAKKTTIYLEDQVSVLEDEKKFGEIIIQKRRLEKDKSLLRDSQNLTPVEIQTIKTTQRIDPRYSCSIDY
jgi:hypothetical protein